MSVMQFAIWRLIATLSGFLVGFLLYIIILKHVEYMRWTLDLEISHACLWKAPSL